MILKGLSILKSKGLNPKFFAAPAHGFDKKTLKVLADINLRNISDGFSRNVCNKNGLTWIPLKSWNPKTKFIGRYNTVCIHLNKDNIKQIKDNIKEQILQKKNIDFESLINSSNEYTILDYFSEMIYSILIKLLFLKKKFSKLI